MDASTYDSSDAGSNDNHRIRLKANGVDKTINLPDLPGPNQGDSWQLDLNDDFGFTGCIKINDIERISILEGGNDGWKIESITTYAVVDQNSYEMTSEDIDVNRWIDGDGPTPHKKFILNLVL